MNATCYDLKQGNCTPLEYFRANYKGTVAEVKTSKLKTKLKHHFFVIKNAILDSNNNKITEVKLYDLNRGIIHKEKTDTPIGKVNPTQWFHRLIRTGVVSDYINLLNDLEQE